jgi:hypothetical protein
MPLSVTSSRVSPVYPQTAEIYDFVAGAALAPGDAVRLDATTGKAVLANAASAANSGFRGLALNSAGAGQGVSVLKRGHVYGFDLAALNYGALVYLDNASGDLGNAAGTVSVVVGSVAALPDDARTRAIYIDAAWK